MIRSVEGFLNVSDTEAEAAVSSPVWPNYSQVICLDSLRSFIVVNGSLVPYGFQPEELSQNVAGDTSTTSAVYVTMSGMSLPCAYTARYQVNFSSSGRVSSNNRILDIALFRNGVILQASERTVMPSANVDCIFSIHYFADVSQGDVLDVRYRTTGGTFTMHERTLTIRRLG